MLKRIRGMFLNTWQGCQKYPRDLKRENYETANLWRIIIIAGTGHATRQVTRYSSLFLSFLCRFLPLPTILYFCNASLSLALPVFRHIHLTASTCLHKYLGVHNVWRRPRILWDFSFPARFIGYAVLSGLCLLAQSTWKHVECATRSRCYAVVHHGWTIELFLSW